MALEEGGAGGTRGDAAAVDELMGGRGAVLGSPATTWPTKVLASQAPGRVKRPTNWPPSQRPSCTSPLCHSPPVANKWSARGPPVARPDHKQRKSDEMTRRLEEEEKDDDCEEEYE